MTDHEKQTESPGALDDLANQVIDGLDLDELVKKDDLPSFELEIIDRVLEHYIAERLKDIDCYAINDHDHDDVPEPVDIVNRVREKLMEMHAQRVVK